MIKEVYLNLGSSIHPKTNISRARREISFLKGVSVIAMSKTYISKAVGIRSYRRFHNASLLIETNLSIHEFKKLSKEIERAFGRSVKTSASTKDRPIDIDIITLKDDIDTLDINALQPYERVPLLGKHYRLHKPFYGIQL